MFNPQVPATPSDSQPLKESCQVSRNYTKALLVPSSKLRGIQVYLMSSFCMSTRHLASHGRGGRCQVLTMWHTPPSYWRPSRSEWSSVIFHQHEPAVVTGFAFSTKEHLSWIWYWSLRAEHSGDWGQIQATGWRSLTPDLKVSRGSSYWP